MSVARDYKGGRGEKAYGVAAVNASVEDIHAGPLPGAFVVAIVGIIAGAAGEAGETPGGMGLGDDCVGGDGGVLLDVFDLDHIIRFKNSGPAGPFETHLGMMLQVVQLRCAEWAGKSVEARAGKNMISGLLVQGQDSKGGAGFELDNVSGGIGVELGHCGD